MVILMGFGGGNVRQHGDDTPGSPVGIKGHQQELTVQPGPCAVSLRIG